MTALLIYLDVALRSRMHQVSVITAGDASKINLDFDLELHGGVREIICETAHYINPKGWKIKSSPKVISSTECEVEVYHPIAEGLFAHRINVKLVEDISLKTFCKEYYCVGLSDLNDETGVSRTTFYGWTVATMVDKIKKLFPSLA